jgi:hypothetical protein
VHDDNDVRRVTTVAGHELGRPVEEEQAVDMDIEGDEDHSEGGSEQGMVLSGCSGGGGVGRLGTPDPVLPASSVGKRAVTPLS